MKKIISCLLALLGLNTACGQQPYTDMSVDEFDNLIAQPDVQLLDVRMAKEVERGVVDIETLKHTNEQLIATLDEAVRIQAEGTEKRRVADELLDRVLLLRKG